ncbi:MAG: amino acid adenylation domain-containing protein, partial [Candidatus Bipolaricaulia bacterium]
VYNLSFAARLNAPLDVAALEQSLNEIVNRHEVLRTTFATVDGQPVQVIALDLILSLPVVDLRELPETEQETELRQLAIEEAQRPFDLARGPLLRLILLQLGEEEYVVLFTMHHIVSDAWSMGIFIREIAVLYQAFSTGRPSPLPELPIQYADFAVWQRERFQDEMLETQLAYWKQQLGDRLPVLELPIDRPRPAIQSHRGAHHPLALPKSLTDSLNALSRQEEVTVFMTLLAAFKALLHRYTGQDDIVVGSPIAGHNRAEIEELIGFFINTLVLRTDLSGDPTFRELLGRVREVALGAYTHQDLPFERLVDELQPERDLSLNPLFQVMFQLLNAPMSTLELPDLSLNPLEIDNEIARFDLALFMIDANGLKGWMEYNTDLFDADTIAQMARHFQTLLEGIVADPDQRLSELPLLSAAECHQLLVEWNDTQADYPKDVCIHQLFEAQVERTPDAVAVVYEDQQLTYRELNRRANQLAHHVRTLGVRPEVSVGMFMERSLELVVGLLGILKAGGVYVPFDPTYPKARLTLMLEDTQASVLLTQERLVKRLPECSAKIVCLDTDWGVIAQESVENPINEVTTDHLAYVIYTSGSTGTPKGVMVEHRGLRNLAEVQAQTLDVAEGSRVLQLVTFSFDASLWDVFMALLTGGTLYVATPESRLPGPALIQLLRDQAITTVTLPPSVLAALPAEELPALRTITVTGEACPADIVARWAPGRRFFNGYGPTEATIGATIGACTADGRKPTIGRPFANVNIYLLDAHLQPVPIGVPGELYIAGVSLARGYLNDPGLTAEKFIPNPFSDEPGTRLYKTGDLARYRPDGQIEFLGRTDHQVKIRGFRIELEEIEAVLDQHPAVREAVVLTREDAPGGKRLVAYVVSNQEQAPMPGELRSFLKEKLPDYMVPSAFVMLDALPLTPNGKVDRRALPKPVRISPEVEKSFVAPRTPTEEKLAEIWAQVLGVEQVSIHDNFFELGGHSLLIPQLILRVREAFQMELPLRYLFEAPTVAELAQALDVIQQEGPPTTIDAMTTTELSAEVALDPIIHPEVVPDEVEHVTEPAHIFLTGATGFLGAFLLHELLQQTQADIYCLIRSANEEQGKKRLQANLESYSLWDENLSSRIIPVVGDLSQPLLGLSAHQFQTLARKIDVIYHNGAWVNLIYSYDVLKAPNVLGTQEVLRLASQTKVKPVHYVSTIGVFPLGHYPDDKVVREQDDLDHGGVLYDGYSQSKWVAEKLVRLARSRGLPVCIYRPGRITGHSQTGAWNTNDFPCRMVKGCIQLGSIPDLDIGEAEVDLTPVNYVSRAIVHLSKQTELIGKTFHLVNPHPLHPDKVVAWIRSLGLPIRQISYDDWREELINLPESSMENALLPLLPLLIEQISEERIKRPQFDCQNTFDELEGTSITCPPVDAELLNTYFSYFIRSGFLEVPQPDGELRHSSKETPEAK